MRAVEFMCESLNNRLDKNHDGTFDDGRLIPHQRWTISTKQFPHEVYRTALAYGARDTYTDKSHNIYFGRYTFYTKHEHDEFVKFLQTQNIPYDEIGDRAENGEEEDSVHSVSPVPSPGFRDIF